MDEDTKHKLLKKQKVFREFTARRKYDNHPATFVEKECIVCGSRFVSEKSKKRLFCSRSCSAKYNASGRFAERNSRWKGGRIKDGNGYILRYDYSTRKHIREHRMIWEKHTGEKLSDKAVIHHIDLDRKNNDISNLMKFENHKEHMDFHNKLTFALIEYIRKINEEDLMKILRGEVFEHSGKTYKYKK